MAGNGLQLPALAERAEGLAEVMPYGKGEIYTYPNTGHGDLILPGDGIPSRFGETGILAFRNKVPHPRYGDRLIVRRLDNALFGLVRFVPPGPNFEDITRRSWGTELRRNHLALRIDGEVPELPETPQVGVVDSEGLIEFWGGLLDRLKSDFSNQ